VNAVGREHFRPPPLCPQRPTLVAPVRIDPTGETGPTRGQAAGPHWRQTSQGLYVPAHVERTVEQRIVEAAALLTRHGAVTGWAALRWCNARWFDGLAADGRELPIDLALSNTTRLRPRAGIEWCRERWDPADVVVIDGVPVTLPVRSTAFAMRYADGLWKAVTALDMAAYDDLVSIEEVAAYVGCAPRFGLSSWTGVGQAREAIALASENSWSPREVWMRLVWEREAGLPRPLMNQPVFDLQGRLIGTPDLLEPLSGTVGQYDSALHLEGRQRARDVLRDERYREVGLETFSVVTGESSRSVASRMQAVHRRASARSEDPRRWSIRPPAWWTATVTVEQRRALSESERERLLRHRRAA
jgi:hypothetical protein